jgi:hypothetical protein
MKVTKVKSGDSQVLVTGTGARNIFFATFSTVKKMHCIRIFVFHFTIKNCMFFHVCSNHSMFLTIIHLNKIFIYLFLNIELLNSIVFRNQDSYHK